MLPQRVLQPAAALGLRRPGAVPRHCAWPRKLRGPLSIINQNNTICVLAIDARGFDGDTGTRRRVARQERDRNTTRRRS